MLDFLNTFSIILRHKTMKDEKEYLSKEKYKELENELDSLKNVRRKKVAERLEFAKSLGDLSENAEYHEARQEQAEIEDRINQLETILQNASIIKKNGHESSNKVSIGSIVVIKKEGASETQTYKIVGAEEADTAEGKISYKSPVGEALVGHSKGDKITPNTPSGEIVYTIIDIK